MLGCLYLAKDIVELVCFIFDVGRVTIHICIQKHPWKLFLDLVYFCKYVSAK